MAATSPRQDAQSAARAGAAATAQPASRTRAQGWCNRRGQLRAALLAIVFSRDRLGGDESRPEGGYRAEPDAELRLHGARRALPSQPAHPRDDALARRETHDAVSLDAAGLRSHGAVS